MEEQTSERAHAPADESAGQATRKRPDPQAGLRRALADAETFGSAVLRMPLRPYQAEVARAVLASVAEGGGTA